MLCAGPEPRTAPDEQALPQVGSVRAPVMVNFLARDTVPPEFDQRVLYQHNDTVTLMRTTPEENQRLGTHIGRKLAAARGPTVLMLPLAGVSAIDCAGQPFDDPEARAALFDALRKSAPNVERLELEQHINDPEFAAAAAHKLIELMHGDSQ